jgi:hypothetical protein
MDQYSNGGSLSDPSSFSLFPAFVAELIELRHAKLAQPHLKQPRVAAEAGRIDRY